MRLNLPSKLFCHSPDISLLPSRIIVNRSSASFERRVGFLSVDDPDSDLIPCCQVAEKPIHVLLLSRVQTSNAKVNFLLWELRVVITPTDPSDNGRNNTIIVDPRDALLLSVDVNLKRNFI